MNCRRCNYPLKPNMKRCPRCNLPILPTDRNERKAQMPLWQLVLRILAVLAAMLVTLSLVTFIVVRINYYRTSKKNTEQYVKHTVEIITLESGMTGHAISFFGNDGDCVYVEELNESYMFVGGVARVEFADYIWFEEDPLDIDSALITFSPIYISSAGEKTRLPAFQINVPVPEAPITITSPASDYVKVITSQTSLNMNVVYGSQVIINGEDVTGSVDRSGGLSLTLNIYPTGANNISIIVRTPNHKEARRDIVFYRDEMEINLEVATSVTFSSTLSYMTVSGKTDPGAWITVDSAYDSSSLIIDQETGKFSFKATFSEFGDNLVSFRASKDGLKDSTISFYVNYLPAKAEYTRNAWKMDYKQLRLYYEQWKNRVFLCKGKIVDSYYTDDVQYSVMDVGSDDEQQLLVLENRSDIQSMNIGGTYSVYADVAGRLFYGTNYVPYLIARYSASK